MAGPVVSGRSWFSAGLVICRSMSVTVSDVCSHPAACAVSVCFPSWVTGSSAFHCEASTGTLTPLIVTGPWQLVVPETFRLRDLGARSLGPGCGVRYFPSVVAMVLSPGGLVMAIWAGFAGSRVNWWLEGSNWHGGGPLPEVVIVYCPAEA